MRSLTVVVRSQDPNIAALLRQRAPEVTWADGKTDLDTTPDMTIDDDGSGTLSVVAKGAAMSDAIPVDKKEFTESPAVMLRLLGQLAQRTAELEAARREIEVAHHIRDLMATRDLAKVYEKITSSVVGLLRADSGTLLFHDSREERFVARCNTDPDYEDLGEALPGIPAELIEQALASHALYAVSDPSAPTRLVLFPILLDETLIGIVRIRYSAAVPQPEQLASAVRYLTDVGHVLSNVYLLTRSQDLSMLDDLTRAYNRRFFESHLDEEIERARRYGSIVSIIFLDLDDLKVVNNRFGHLAGSRTLQEVAKRILAAVRSIDKVVRFGGDEFCIILPQTDQEQASHVANRVKKSLSERMFELEPGASVPITASFGVASYPTHAQTKEDLIRQADAAMFLVKSTTKNSIKLAEGADPTDPTDPTDPADDDDAQLQSVVP